MPMIWFPLHEGQQGGYWAPESLIGFSYKFKIMYKFVSIILSEVSVCPRRKHIDNIDDSLMFSSIISVMHHFYIEHRKHVTMMNYWWRNSSVYVFCGYIQSNKTTNSSNFIFYNQIEQNHWVERQKSNNSDFEQKKLTDVLEIDFYAWSGSILTDSYGSYGLNMELPIFFRSANFELFCLLFYAKKMFGESLPKQPNITFSLAFIRLSSFFRRNFGPGWRLREIQRWSALIQNTFRSVSALLITWKSLNSADSALNSVENGNFQS